MKIKTKEIHLNKFQKLKKLKLRLQDNNDKIKEKWIVNLSKYKRLTKKQTSVLEKGLNYAIAPGSIRKSEIVASCEKSIIEY